jgi:hypothetical protein
LDGISVDGYNGDNDVIKALFAWFPNIKSLILKGWFDFRFFKEELIKEEFVHEPLKYLVNLKLDKFYSKVDVKYLIPKCPSLREIYSIDTISQSIMNAVDFIKSNQFSAK